MAHPPRIPVHLPWGTSVTYFVTLCEAERKPAWANRGFFDAFSRAVERLESRRLWYVMSAVVMPDHLHLLATPMKDRAQPIGNLSAALKRWVGEHVPHPDWNWQPGSFDRLLRSNESETEKWIYMRENPVRAGLVNEWQEWPWTLGMQEPRENAQHYMG